jgi:hypothetical protein
MFSVYLKAPSYLYMPIISATNVDTHTHSKPGLSKCLLLSLIEKLTQVCVADVDFTIS